MQSGPLGNKAFGRTLDPKRFWRLDKEKDPELRHTVLTLVAYHDLKEMIVAHGGERDAGIAAFHNQNDGDGSMLPETLCLAHYGLRHDDRAPRPKPSEPGSASGSCLPVEPSLEESWAECERHARNLPDDESFAKLLFPAEPPEPKTRGTGVP